MCLREEVVSKSRFRDDLVVGIIRLGFWIIMI